MNARYRVESWFDRIGRAGEKMKREDVCFVMVQARHLIEASGPEKYRVTSFHADWMVHTALDRSLVSLEMLRDITGVIAANMDPTSAELPSLISGVIGLPKLRAEMMALFTQNRLPLTIFEYYQNWKYFGMFLVWHIAGQPVSWPARPSGRVKVLREEMLALSRPHDFAVEALAIVEQEGTYDWWLEMSRKGIRFSITGGFDAIEGPAAFKLPPESA